MGQQSEALEYHADLVPTELAQGLRAVAQDVLAIDQDLAAAGLDQPVDMPHERGLAGAGQAHHHEDLARANGQRQVVDADHAAGSLQHLGLAGSLAQHLQGLVGALAEDLAHPPQDDLVHPIATHCPCPRSGRP
ncbi:hypothetical protein D3C84_1041060 [compost metagenome]